MDEINIPQQTVSGISGGGELSLYQYFNASPLFAEFSDFNGPDRQIFLAEYSRMSQNLKNFFSSVETATNISTLGLSYQLDDGQVSAIASTVREVIVGKVFIKDFSLTISSKLGIDDIKASNIVNNIISKSFAPIIEDLKRIQRSKFPDKITQLQKEAQPQNLTQSTAKPVVPRAFPTPGQSIQQSQNEQDKPSQPTTSNEPPKISSPGQPIRPPLQQPGSSAMSNTERSNMVMPPKPIPPPLQTPPRTVTQPEPQQAKPTPPPVVEPQRPSSQISPKPSPNRGGLPDAEAQKSLEAELEKVAGVIDLRSKSNQ